MNNRFKAAGKAALVHLGISLIIASSIAIFSLMFWFPSPYLRISGGLHLFLILITVDILCGPLITAIVFNPKKNKKELCSDFGVIFIIQIIALAYGLYVLSAARPVAVVFESDRFVSVSAAQIDKDLLPLTLEKYRSLPWSGPILLSTRSPKDGNEFIKSIELSMRGIEPSARPDWWKEYDSDRASVMSKMKRLDDLYSRSPEESKNIIRKSLKSLGVEIKDATYLPLVSSRELNGAIVILDKKQMLLDFLR